MRSSDAASASTILNLGASPRAALCLLRCARARALLDGRYYFTHEDIHAVALGVLSLLRHAPLVLNLGAVHFFSLSVIGFFGPVLARWLNRDVHLRNTSSQPGIWSGFLMGFAFAFGWTPCIGPVLTAVLTLAAASNTITRGVLLLAVYSAGLAVPFLLTALGIGQFMRFYQNFRKYLHAVEVFSGALLLFVGTLVFVNKLIWLSGKLTFLNRFSL